MAGFLVRGRRPATPARQLAVAAQARAAGRAGYGNACGDAASAMRASRPQNRIDRSAAIAPAKTLAVQ